MKLREEQRDLAVTTNDVNDWSKYRRTRNIITSKVKLDKKKYLEDLYQNADKNKNVKSLYRITTEQLGWKTGGPPQSLVNHGKLINKPREIAELMNTLFLDKIKTLNNNIPARTKDPLDLLRKTIQNWKGAKDRKVFELREVTLVEVCKILNDLNNSTTMGNDGLDAMSCKIISSSIFRPLQHILNTSINTQTFCTKWKIGKLIPLLKNGTNEKLNMKSYRPISILPTVSKMMEKAIQMQLMQYMEESKQFNRNLHAYRNLVNTTTALLQLTDYSIEAADSGLITQIMMLDQSAAFDSVDFGILDGKMELYHFSENTRKWFRSYLSNRS